MIPRNARPPACLSTALSQPHLFNKAPAFLTKKSTSALPRTPFHSRWHFLPSKSPERHRVLDCACACDCACLTDCKPGTHPRVRPPLDSVTSNCIPPRHPTQQLRLPDPFRDSSRQVVSFIPSLFPYISTPSRTLRSDFFVTALHSDDAVVPRQYNSTHSITPKPSTPTPRPSKR